MLSRQQPRPTRAETRADIEDAATRLFAERGYAATTVDDIAAAAGLSKPMLYRHFDSKKELHMALLERHRDELAAAALQPFLAGEREPIDRLPAMIDAWFVHAQQNPYVLRLLFRDTTGDRDVQALHVELQRRQRAADVALIREFAPRIPEAELEPLGEVIRSSLTGLALWWLDHPEVPRDTLVAAMLRMVRGLLATAR